MFWFWESRIDGSCWWIWNNTFEMIWVCSADLIFNIVAFTSIQNYRIVGKNKFSLVFWCIESCGFSMLGRLQIVSLKWFHGIERKLKTWLVNWWWFPEFCIWNISYKWQDLLAQFIQIDLAFRVDYCLYEIEQQYPRMWCNYEISMVHTRIGKWMQIKTYIYKGLHPYKTSSMRDVRGNVMLQVCQKGRRKERTNLPFINRKEPS